MIGMQQKAGPRLALMLPGGGARGAYQVGVVRGLFELAGGRDNPFPLIIGTSAGAINAAVLASHAHEFAYGLERLSHFWANMQCHHIYRTDWLKVAASASHWLASLLFGRLGVPGPRSLLDTEPLRNLLTRETRLEGIEQAIVQGALHAAAITASAYTASRAVTFYHGAESLQPWQKVRRIGRRERLSVEHLLASAALPVLFPPIALGNEYYGDGSLRQTAPLSPAVHLGADRILVVTTRDEQPDTEPKTPGRPPSAGEIAGHMLDIVFMDNLQSDLNRLERINDTLALIPPEARKKTALKPIETLVIRPSKDVRAVARRHIKSMPASVKTWLAGVGAWRSDSRLPSYLLFEAPYTQELMELGYQDALAQRTRVKEIMGQPEARDARPHAE